MIFQHDGDEVLQDVVQSVVRRTGCAGATRGTPIALNASAAKHALRCNTASLIVVQIALMLMRYQNEDTGREPIFPHFISQISIIAALVTLT